MQLHATQIKEVKKKPLPTTSKNIHWTRLLRLTHRCPHLHLQHQHHIPTRPSKKWMQFINHMVYNYFALQLLDNFTLVSPISHPNKILCSISLVVKYFYLALRVPIAWETMVSHNFVLGLIATTKVWNHQMSSLQRINNKYSTLRTWLSQQDKNQLEG